MAALQVDNYESVTVNKRLNIINNNIKKSEYLYRTGYFSINFSSSSSSLFYLYPKEQVIIKNETEHYGPL